MNITQQIQVWYDDVDQKSIPARELTSFQASDKSSGTMRQLLITNDHEETIDLGSVQIQCVPAVKYLLFDSKNWGQA